MKKLHRSTRLADATVKAVLKDYAAKVPIAQITQRHKVSVSVIYRYVNLHGLNRTAARPPKVRCEDCGVNTRATSGICRDCATDVALPDGAWVLDPKRRVQVWEAAA